MRELITHSRKLNQQYRDPWSMDNRGFLSAARSLGEFKSIYTMRVGKLARHTDDFPRQVLDQVTR